MSINYKLMIGNESNDWIILFHGIGGSSTIWFRQVKELKKIFNLILVDLPSHGKSENINKKHGLKYSIDSLAIDIKEFLVDVCKKHDIKKFHLSGVSLGTILIHELLKDKEFSKNVLSAILVGSITKFNLRSRFLLSTAKFLKLFLPLKSLYYLLAYILLPHKNNRESRSLFLKEAKKVEESEFQKWFYIVDEVDNIYTEEVYKSDDISKLYISGSQDVMFINELKNSIINDRNAKFEIIENAGHVCNVDKSAEFNNIIKKHYIKKKEVIF